MSDNAGRWTSEEHERFLRGLEYHGKKWTKVAEVVGTRSTVQVRSHAQKYFQKMVKGGAATESVEMFGRPGMPGGGIPRPYQRRRLNIDSLRKAIPVPPPLQPFVPPGSNDIASGLYTYLSPDCVPTGESGPEEQRPIDGDPVESSGSDSAASDPPCSRNSVPEWYKCGKDVTNLLDQAEGLDWMADSGGTPEVHAPASLGGGGARAADGACGATSWASSSAPPPPYQPGADAAASSASGGAADAGASEASKPGVVAPPEPPPPPSGAPSGGARGPAETSDRPMPPPKHGPKATSGRASRSRDGASRANRSGGGGGGGGGGRDRGTRNPRKGRGSTRGGRSGQHGYDFDTLGPPPAANPGLEMTFSSMEVDDTMFDALLNDDDFIVHATEHGAGVAGGGALGSLPSSIEGELSDLGTKDA